MRLTSSMRAVCALAGAAALALPASAAAVPYVTSASVKLDTAGRTFADDPTGASLDTQTQYVVSVDGYAVNFKEDNGVVGAGVLDYSALPTAYRAPATADEKRTYASAQTDVQPHATCSGVAALDSRDSILGWQTNAGNDPYYNYVPWQRTTAGLGDDPAKWIAVVRTAVRVDLSTVTDFDRACRDLGGTYHRADTATSIANQLIANATAPLNTQIASLQRDVATIRRARDASDRAAATARDAQRLAEATYQALFTKPITLTLAAKRFAPADGVVMITGSPTDPVDVTLELATKKKAKKLGLTSRVLAESLGELNADGGALLTLEPDKDTLAALADDAGTVPAIVHAVSGGNEATARVTLKLEGKPKAKKGKKKARAHARS